MKSTTLLAPLAGILLFGVQNSTATCFGSWHSKWGQVGENSAIDFIYTACTQNGGMFTVDGEGKNLFFQVQNLNNGAGFDLADGDCVQRLTNEIRGCQQGGESSVSGWRFRLVVFFLLTHCGVLTSLGSAEPNGC